MHFIHICGKNYRQDKIGNYKLTHPLIIVNFFIVNDALKFIFENVQMSSNPINFRKIVMAKVLFLHYY
jgi:hypothetical protein